MFKKVMVVLIGVVLFLSGGVVFSQSTQRTIQAHYPGITIYVNDQAIQPKDANGKVVEPFIVDGTTYLPVRAIGNALGCEVDWKPETNSVYLWENGAPASTQTNVQPSAQDGYFRYSQWGMTMEQVEELESAYRTTRRGTSITLTTEDNYGLLGVSSYVSYGFKDEKLVRGTISPYDFFTDAEFSSLVTAYIQKYGGDYYVEDHEDGTSSYFWTTKTCKIELEKEIDDEVWIRFVTF